MKIRLQGTKEDMEKVVEIIEKNEELKIDNVSNPLINKGTNRFFRVYGELEIKKTHR